MAKRSMKVHPKRPRLKIEKSIKTTKKMKKWINNRRRVAKKQGTTKSAVTQSLRMAKKVARIEVEAVIDTKSARDLVRALKSPNVIVAKNDQKTRT
jgi:subtilisin-like proprotein convertase family protein